MLKKIGACALALCVLFSCAVCEQPSGQILLDRYENAVRAAWLGKMVGVSTGRSCEFAFKGEWAQHVPTWNEALLDIALIEDDLYIPYAMMKVLDEQGTAVSGAEMAVALYPYSFEFWGDHLRTFEAGIAPPSAGHPAHSPYPDALSYSFAADFSGLIAPGNISVPVELAQRFGSMLVYADGIYGGAFVGAMYTKALMCDDMRAILDTALGAVPQDAWLYQAIKDVLDMYDAGESDAQKAFNFITDKYYFEPMYNWIEWPYGGRLNGINLDAKLNCAYIAIALLYGEGDIEKTLEIALKCGQDTDSNAANALGVLFTTIGYEDLPETYKRPLKGNMTFLYVEDTFDALVKLTKRLALKYNTCIETAQGTALVIQKSGAPLIDSPARNSRTPAKMDTVLFSDEQMARMVKPALEDGGFERAWHADVYPPWQLIGWGLGSGGIDISAGKASHGRNNAYLCPDRGNTMGIAQNRIAVLTGGSYTLSCKARASGDNVSLILCVSDAQSGDVIAQTEAPGTRRYQTLSVDFIPQGYAVNIRLLCTARADGAWVQADEFELFNGSK